MPKILDNERNYIIETKSEEWDAFRNIAHWWWTKRVAMMSEGEVLKMYYELTEENRPLSWLNGGEK